MLATPRSPGRPQNPFDCSTCTPGDRVALGCSRADLGRVAWDVDVGRLALHLGRYPERSYVPPPGIPVGGEIWRTPLEDPADGCPGGDQVCRFVSSVAEFSRARTADGGRVENPRLTRAKDWLILDAVLEYELQQDRCAAQRMRDDLESERSASGRGRAI